MALGLKDKENGRLAPEVVAVTGETRTGAIRQALAERLEREPPFDLAARIRAIGEHCASLPDVDTRSPNEILGYNENGLWS